MEWKWFDFVVPLILYIVVRLIFAFIDNYELDDYQKFVVWMLTLIFYFVARK